MTLNYFIKLLELFFPVFIWFNFQLKLNIYTHLKLFHWPPHFATSKRVSIGFSIFDFLTIIVFIK